MNVDEIKVICLCGSGEDTVNLALSFAIKKFKVKIFSENYSTMEETLDYLEFCFNKFSSNIKISNEQIESIKNRITLTLILNEACKDADIVIDTSKFFIRRTSHPLIIDFICKPETIFAFDISDVFLSNSFNNYKKIERTKKMIGVYIFNPYITRKRIDIIKIRDTSSNTMNVVIDLFKIINFKFSIYKTSFLDFTIYRKINQVSNRLIWFKDQLKKKSFQGKSNFAKNLISVLREYINIVLEKLILLIKTPFRKFKNKLNIFKVYLSKFINKRKDKKKLMVNLGGGLFFKKNWRVLEKKSDWYQYKYPYIDYFLDLSKNLPLPFKDNSVSFFYTSHVMEHIPEEFVQNNFNEIYRCLKPGGIVRFVLPDFDLAYEAYGKGDEKFFSVVSRVGKMKKIFLPNLKFYFLRFFSGYYQYCELDYVDDFESNYKSMKKEEFADYYTQNVPKEWQDQMVGLHANWFNFDKVKRMLKIAGFKTIYKSEFQKSKFPELRGGKGRSQFDLTGYELSFYSEAMK